MGAFLQANIHIRVLVILNKYYGVVFNEFSDYCGKPLLLKKAMYGMTLEGKYFAECPTCLVLFRRTEKGGSQLWLILYVDDFLYFGTMEKTHKIFELEFGSRFNIEFQGNVHWYLAARISQ